jgi:hypothetical protein
MPAGAPRWHVKISEGQAFGSVYHIKILRGLTASIKPAAREHSKRLYQKKETGRR